MEGFAGQITKALADYAGPLIQPQNYIDLKTEYGFEITHLLLIHQKRTVRLLYVSLTKGQWDTLLKKKKKKKWG